MTSSTSILTSSWTRCSVTDRRRPARPGVLVLMPLLLALVLGACEKAGKDSAEGSASEGPPQLPVVAASASLGGSSAFGNPEDGAPVTYRLGDVDADLASEAPAYE